LAGLVRCSSETVIECPWGMISCRAGTANDIRAHRKKW
jgi:hypothetical protein